MQIIKTTGLGSDALQHAQKYNAFMGISIRNSFFSKKTMRKYFLWLYHYFHETTILLIDYPDRYNTMIFTHLSEKDALNKTIKISDCIKRAYEKIKKQYNISNIKIVQFNDFLNNYKYKYYYKKFYSSKIINKTYV